MAAGDVDFDLVAYLRTAEAELACWGERPDQAETAVAAHEARLDALGVNRRPRTGPRPWQRPGAGRRAPVGVHPIEVVEAYLVEAAARSEPPTHL
jgi:hexosaminidase